MKIFITILLVIILTSLVSSIVFTCLSNRVLDKISIHEKDNYYIVYTTRELYPKYKTFKKLGDNLLLFCAIFLMLGMILSLIGYI